MALKLLDDAVQFSVKGLASNSDSWEMWVTNDDSIWVDITSDAVSPVQGFNADCVLYNASYGVVGVYSNEWMSNVVNGDDRSFFGYLDGDKPTSKYNFVLQNVTKSKYYKFVYAPEPFELLTSGAYLLPPLTLEGNGVTPAAGCKWSLVE